MGQDRPADPGQCFFAAPFCAPVTWLVMVCGAAIGLGLQALVVLQIPDPEPVRIGLPLPARAVTGGLRSDRGQLQWRVLGEQPDPVTGRVWVEVALCGVRGRVAIRRGRVPPSQDGNGPVLVREEVEELRPDGRHRTLRLTWCDGTVDVEESLQLAGQNGEWRDGGWLEGEIQRRRSQDWGARWQRVGIPAEFWRDAGVLPVTGRPQKELQKALLDLARGVARRVGDCGAGLDRDHGDHWRGPPAGDGSQGGEPSPGGGVFANGEFDLAWGLMRFGLLQRDPAVVAMADAAAQHLCDVDLDRESGLAYPHGRDHRGGRPDPGHTWLQGLLLVGCVAADDERIQWAGTMARGLARVPATGEGRKDRARDLAWPLVGMEAWLRFHHEDAVVRAADARADAILARFDRAAGLVRFGEGVSAGGYYRERAWLTSGMVIPALLAHGNRVGEGRVRECLGSLRTTLAAPLLTGKQGLPVAWMVGAEGAFGFRWRQQGGELPLLLEGLLPRARDRLLRRGTVRQAVLDTMDPDHPEACTRLAMLLRCGWLLR